MTAASVYIGGASAIPINPSVNDIGHATDHGKIYATLAIYENLLTSGGAYVTPTGVQTLTNKTLTSPVINGGTANFNSASINGVAISTTGGGGGTTLTIQSNGANSNTASILNFTGGATVTPGTSGSISINIPSPGSASLTIADEGINPITNTNYINFTGAGVTTAGTSGSVTVTIPGGSGGNALTLNTVTLPATASLTGTMQFDGSTPQFTTNVSASTRGVVPVAIFTAPAASAATTLSNVAAVNAFPNLGTVNLAASTTYEFEILYLQSGSVGGGTGNLSISFAGTAAPTVSIGYWACAGQGIGTQAPTISFGNSVANTGIMGSNSYYNRSALIKGMVRTTTAGTLIPQMSTGGTPGNTPYVALGSYMKFIPVGASTVVSTLGWV